MRIRAVFTAHRGRYGSPRIHRELRAAGWRVSRRRVERLMRAAGLRARVVRVYHANPGVHRFYDRHPNRLPPLGARRPDQVWLADLTYVPVGRRWHYLAVVVDQYSRRVVAWTLGTRRTARLTRRVLDAALRHRRPRRGLIFHSDRGSEYCAATIRARLQQWEIRQSATRRGPADNPHMESFFHSLKAELLHGQQFASVEALHRALQGYIRYYNHRRRHSALGYRSPVDYERGAA